MTNVRFAAIREPSIIPREELVRPIRSLVALRRFRQANVDQRHLSAGDGVQAAFERGAHFTGLFSFFAGAIKGARD